VGSGLGNPPITLLLIMTTLWSLNEAPLWPFFLLSFHCHAYGFMLVGQKSTNNISLILGVHMLMAGTFRVSQRVNPVGQEGSNKSAEDGGETRLNCVHGDRTSRHWRSHIYNQSEQSVSRRNKYKTQYEVQHKIYTYKLLINCYLLQTDFLENYGMISPETRNSLWNFRSYQITIIIYSFVKVQAASQMQ